MDRNFLSAAFLTSMRTSLSARRAWIEILAYPDMIICTKSLSARRAWIEILMSSKARRISVVALRKESVDRNLTGSADGGPFGASLSARRAWIEIRYVDLVPVNYKVALRKESVDRNMYPSQCRTFASGSLSARRAWIEINVQVPKQGFGPSLSARRAWIEIHVPFFSNIIRYRRSPQGERG